MATMQFSNSFVANAPIERAFALMADVNEHPRIFSINHGIRNYHGGPVQVGDTWESVGKFMGQETVTQYTMAEYEAPTHLLYKTASSSGDGSITWNFKEVEGGTQVEQIAEGQPKGFFASLAAPLLKGNLQKQLVEDGDNFKRLVEFSPE